MSWVVRVTNTVPFSSRPLYEKRVKSIIKKVGELGNVKHVSSYRVVFGNALQFMHLFEIERLSDWEEWSPDICGKVRVKDAYQYKEDSLVTDSRYEVLKPLDF